MYVHRVEHFSQYFHDPRDQLDPKISASSPNKAVQRPRALRFFSIQVHKKNWSIADTPYLTKVVREPEILSPEEAQLLIEKAGLQFYRIRLVASYAAGARRGSGFSEVVDIDIVAGW